MVARVFDADANSHIEGKVMGSWRRIVPLLDKLREVKGLMKSKEVRKGRGDFKGGRGGCDEGRRIEEMVKKIYNNQR